jgi:antitoxin component YwqK of YwqJK toxin-antitoxin module
MKTVSKILIIIFLGLHMLSCNARKDDFYLEPKIAKTVPLIYLKLGDSGFSKHQDTLYYHDKFYTGYVYDLFENKDTSELKSYFNGVEEGLQKKWYTKNRLEEERFYINGKKEGLQQGRWPNGNPRFYFSAFNDEYSGEFKEWMENGLLVKWFHYNKGYEEGSQKLWWSDGKTRANYVIKKGRKFGLLGYRICENPYDSIIKK